MIQKTTKPLYILADANIIIEIHRLGIWKQFTRQCRIATTEYIVQNEALFFRSKFGNVEIDVHEYIDSGAVITLSATANELAAIYDKFEAAFLEPVDSGELEALSLIIANKISDALFCTADGPAIEALAMIGKSSVGISLEKVFEKTGFSNSSGKLRHEYQEMFFQKHLGIGKQNYVTNFGLKPAKKYRNIQP
jgi:hypothetical protein